MLTGKNIVVTGCIQGIGKETVKVLAENNANVIACAYKETEEFVSYCEEIANKCGVNIIPVYFDMADNESIKEAARTIQKMKIEVHGLVNVAGINRDAYFSMITYKDMLDTFQVNFFSQIMFSQYIVKIMQRYKTEGSIIFTSSISALDGNKGQTAYASSKAALIGAMKTMALELGESGIRVNAVAPGVIETPMTTVLPQEIIQAKMASMELPRLGKSSEVANTYTFLLSDLSKHITGQLIRIDGGIG